MAVSVIVSNFNGAKFLPQLMDSLFSQRGVKLEVIVVDRNSHDNSLEILGTYPEVVIVHEPPDSGLVAGYTAGANHAKYEHLFFCNEDMWFDDNCIGRLEQRIDLDQRIAAADPWQWSYDGERWLHGGVRFQRRRWEINSPHPRYSLESTVSLVSGTKVPLPCAGAFLIHRNVFQMLGGWDTSFFLDNEDVDLFIRAWQQGWFCVTVPEAKVYHAVGASNCQTLTKTRQQVLRKRYVSGYASEMIIPVKYFSPSVILLGMIGWLVRFANNVFKLRFTKAWLDIVVWKEIFQRLPDSLKFRSSNARWNFTKPGEDFFSQLSFQAER